MLPYDEKFASSIRSSLEKSENSYWSKSNKKYENVNLKNKGENKVPFKNITN